MAILGTRKFWIPAQGASPTQKENQILKNKGYFNIQLHSVNYMSVGNFFQKIFGGSDTVALATNLKFQSGVDTIEAISLQDVRKIKVDRNNNFGLQRNVAVKIPIIANAIEIEVKMTAVKNDLLQAKFDMLNKSEYRAALQLAPTVVGQVLTITSLVKTLFTDSDPHAQLEAKYAGIISTQSENNPVYNGKLTKGLLIMLSTNDGDKFDDASETKFEIRGDTLYYDNNQVENTYIIFNISFEELKGDDEKSNWFKKYTDALNNLENILLTSDQNEIEKIYNNSIKSWIEGNALLDADATYINSERIKIRITSLKSINDRYNELKQIIPPSVETIKRPTQPTPTSPGITIDILNSLTGSTSFGDFKIALPETGSFLNNNFIIDPTKTVDSSLFIDLPQKERKLFKLIDRDAGKYLKQLVDNNITWNLGNKIKTLGDIEL